MNERIADLLEKAFAECKTFEDGTMIRTSEALARFAELIVKECMLCCERVISDPVPKSVDSWLNGGSQCIDEIKQHFGVE